MAAAFTPQVGTTLGSERDKVGERAEIKMSGDQECGD